MNYFEALLAEQNRLSDTLLADMPQRLYPASDIPTARPAVSAPAAAASENGAVPSADAHVLSAPSFPPAQSASVPDAEALSRIYERDARRYG